MVVLHYGPSPCNLKSDDSNTTAAVGRCPAEV